MTTDFPSRYIAARRAFIESEFSSLNPMQRRAVLATEGPLLLLAGAGSGKTTVLIRRVENLLRFGRASDSSELPGGVTESDLELLEHPERNFEAACRLAALDPVQPFRVIAITFTNKAAEELKSRLEDKLGEAAKDVWAMTFHAACARILRRDADKLGFPQNFTIYDSADSQSLMKRIIKEMDCDEKLFPCRSVLAQIGRAKDVLLSPEAFTAQAREANDYRKVKMGALYAEYTKRLKVNGAMDFDDLLYHTVRLLQNYEDIRLYYQRKFQYVLVDEYQDTNHLQYLLAALLAGGYGNICVVGDDDQSIYRFRGATIENILSFEKQYKNARVIRLEQNYRSKSHILDAANAVIRNNLGRKGKNLWTEQGTGEPLTLYVAQDEKDEARYVADEVLADYVKSGTWREKVVLYRMNAQSNNFEYAFKRNGIPYRIYGGLRFTDHAEVKDMLAYLFLAASPQDEERLLRVINNPPRGIGQATVDKVRDLAEKFSASMFDIIQSAGDFPELKSAAGKLLNFGALIASFQELSARLPADQLYDEIVERTGYLKMLREKRTDQNLTKIENVLELKSFILSNMADSGDTSLLGFLDMISLYTDLDSKEQMDYVAMMTMHAAKGLEFDSVYLVGAEEGIFPSYRCLGEPEEMEEERRLCYVALTRAREKLTITCARQRTIFGRTGANQVSRFVEEIPDEHIDRPEWIPPRSAGAAAVPARPFAVLPAPPRRVGATA
ncbi:MAG: UvrD-helicase domain-containing protein, partial [Firmicutes bacterium]|nr:UvrD-helicase domain-containing protein [Bacillota bacterium]